MLNAVKPGGRVIIFHNLLPYTFHPKIYLFKSSEEAEVLIGSGNLTEGGLFTNYEASINLKLDLKDEIQIAVLDSIEQTLDKWADTSSRLAHLLNDTFLNRLTSLGLVLSEDLITLDEEGDPESSHHPINDPTSNSRIEMAPDDNPFIHLAVPRAPLVVRRTTSRRPSPTNVSPRTTPKVSRSDTEGKKNTNFVMTLQRTDVGIGQTTEGAPRRSPEIFIPLSARDAAPEFWGWENKFQEDTEWKKKKKKDSEDKYDRLDVPFLLDEKIVTVNMMTWPDKHDFRLRCEALRSAGEVGDILRLEQVDAKTEYEYIAEIIRKDSNPSSSYAKHLAYCVKKVKNSKKIYGYF